MTLLTKQEIERAEDAARHSYRHHMSSVRGQLITQLDSYDYHLIKAVESAVIEKIKAQGVVAWLHEQRLESDVVTTAVKQVWGKVPTGNLAAYSVPLYRLPEGD